MSKVFKNNPQQSKLILEELEERRLFSGGIEGLIASDLDSEAQAIYADADKAKAANANNETSASVAEQQSQEIVFVDAGVDNYQQLVDDIRNNTDSNRNIEVVVLYRDKDGIEEISEFLSHREDLDAIHIISHGSDGSVELGNTSLNADTLEQNNLKIALWANNFADTGDILIYGCNLAQSEVGQSLISELGSLTLTDVAASDDATGHESLGGDWDLEYQAGDIEAAVAPGAELQARYEHILAVINGTAGDDLLLGTTASDVISADAGSDTLESGGGDDQMFGEAGDDLFRFTDAQDGDVITVDGGTETDTIDLSGFASSAVTFGDGVMTVDMGGGQSFSIGYTQVESILFSDLTATVLSSDMTQAGFSGSGIWIDGAEAFKVVTTGAGTLDIAYSRGLDTFSVSAATGVDASSSLTITDLTSNDLIVDQIIIDASFGNLTTNVGIGSISLAGASSNLEGTFTIGGDLGSINMYDLAGTLDVQGDLGTIHILNDLDPGALLNVTGDVTTLLVDDDIGGTVTIGGDVTTFDLTGVQGGSNVQVTASVTVTGSITTLHIDAGVLSPFAIGGDLGTFTGEDLVADMTVGGDVGSVTLASVDPAATFTANGVVGTLVFDVGGTDHGGTYEAITLFVFDGSTGSATATIIGPTAADDTVAIDENTANTTTVTTVSATGATEGQYAEMYWADKVDNAIYRANADGTGGTTTVISGLNAPVGVEVDYNSGKIYWTTNVAGDASVIQSANLDGSGLTTLVTGLTDPDSIALDLTNGKMYWTDDTSGEIRRANLDGTAVEIVLSGLTNPESVALDVDSGKMYWTDHGDLKIQRANLDGTGIEDLVASGLSNVGDIELDLDNGKMYWIDGGVDKIQRANLDGTGVEDLVTSGLNDAYYLALDVSAGKMYWTDDGDNIIQRANLDGTGIEDLVTTGVDDPRDVALSAPATLSGPLSYSITAGNTGNAFTIDANTGEITVADSNLLDFEATPVFSLTVEVQDTVSLLTDTATITVNLNDVAEINQAPTAVNNTGASVAEGATHTITNSELRFDDSEQPASSVIYTVTTSPVNGQLELTTNPNVAITSFTQAQVDAGEVVYVHDGSATAADEFKFDVDDGQGNTTVGQVITGLTNLTNLTNDAGKDRDAVMSPDGTQIAFRSDRDGNVEIYVMDADGSNVVRLTNNAGIDENPSWSADGSQIAFSSDRDGNNEIYVMNADGSAQTRLTNNSSVDSLPSWSPDGTQVVFRSDRDGNDEIYVMDANGSNQTRLTNDLAAESAPTWSPDGSQIVFTSERDGNREIYVMDADGSNQTRITNNAAKDTSPKWSPDGSHILFMSDRDGNTEIYVMDADGSNQTRLTNDTETDQNPSWSTDGTQILFQTGRDGDNEIYVADVLHENRFAITVTAANTAPTFIDGAVGNWNFDEGSGDSVAEGAVGISTATLGSTTGADANDPTWTSGVFGQALQFDGVNDYVEIADAPGIDISGPEFSASLWIKPDRGPGTEDMFFMKGDRQGTSNVNYYLSWKDTGKMTWAFKSDGGFEYIDMDVTLPTVDEWNHIAVVFDRPTVSIYINGTEYTSSVGTGGTSMDKDLVANDDPLWIGAGRDGGSLVTAGNYSAPFSGAIDELALFDRALTAAEVEAIRTSAPPVVTASAFNLDENSAINTVVGTVVANDPDIGDTLSYAITAGNTGGAFSIDGNGQITVINSAALDFETTPVFNLTIEATDDGTPAKSDTVSVAISLNNVNDVPVATGNTVVASEDVALVIGVSDFNFTDAELDSLASVTITDLNLNGGTLTHTGGTVPVTNGMTITAAQLADLTFTSASNDSTDSSFTYTVNDAGSGVTSAVMNITVNAVNDAPTDLVATTTTNSGVTMNADGGNDVYFVADDGGGLLGGLTAVTIEASFSISTPPSGPATLLSYADGAYDEELGLFIQNDGSIIFGAHAGASPFQVSTNQYTELFDGEKHQVSVSWDSPTGTVDFYIDGQFAESFTGYQTGLTITGGGELTFGQDQDSVLGDFGLDNVFSGTLYDVRIFDDVRTAGEVAGAFEQTLPNTETGMIANWVFDDLSSTGVITDTVSGNNLTQQQVIATGFTASVAELELQVVENPADGTVVGTLATIDPDSGDTFTYLLLDDAGGRFDINPANGEITVADGSLIDFESASSHNITVRTTDAGGLNYDEVFTISVTDVNDAPTGTTLVVATLEEAATAIDISSNVTDVDGSVDLTTTLVTSGPSNGSLTNNNDGTFSYTGNANFVGSDSFTYTVEDNDGQVSSDITVTINVSDVNDAPIVSATALSPTWTEGDGPVAVFSGASIDTVESGQLINAVAINVTGLADGSAEILVIDGQAIELTDLNSVTTAANGFDVSVSAPGSNASVTISKSGGFTAVSAEALVNGIAYDNSSDTPQGAVRVVTLSAVQDDGGVANGGVNTTFYNLDSNVAISATNDDPSNVGTLPADVSVTEDVLSYLDLSAIDFADPDANAGELTVTLATSTGGQLTLANAAGITLGGTATSSTLTGTLANLNAYFNIAGNIQYLHATTHLNGDNADTLSVSIVDNGNTGTGGGGSVSLGSVNIDITATNDAPVITSDGSAATADINVAENTTTVTTVTANDVDLDTVTFSITGGADQPLFTILPTGELSFIVAPDYEGPGDNSYEVVVTAIDGHGGTDVQTITVNVTDVNDGVIRVTPLSLAPLGGETLVNTGSTDNQSITSGVSQAIATDANGNYVIVWSSNLQDGAGWGIYAQLFNADGTAQGSEIPINSTTADSQVTASVAMDAAGNFVVTWQSNLQDGDGYGVYARAFNAAGVAQGGEIPVNTYTTGYQGAPGIAMAANGDFVIQWASSVQDPDGSYGIYAQRFNAAGAAQGGEFRVNTYIPGYQQVSSISMDDAGNFVVTWGSLGQDGSNYGVFGQVFNADGSPRGAEFQANTTTQYSQLYNDVTMLPDGRFVVTYQSANADTSTDLYIQAFNADGSKHGGEIKVNAVSDMDYFPIPSISADASGNFTVVWNNSNDGALSGVFMRSYDWDGNALTGEVQVNTTAAGEQLYPEIVAQPGGGFIVAWSGNGAGDADGVFTQRYGLSTDEDGNSTSFQLVLEHAPTADVIIPVSVSDGSEGTVSTGSVTFTSANWSTPQIVTVTGLQDFILDGDQTFTVNIGPATSTDLNFNGLDPADLIVTNHETNTPPVITSDGGGATVSINVAENTTAVTTVTATDADLDTPTFTITGGADQGLFSIDLNSGLLTFDTPPNFEGPGDNSYTVEVTAADGFGGIDIQTINVSVTNVNEAPVANADSANLVFDGDDIVQVADHASLQMSNNLTMEAWFNYSSSGTGSQLILNKEGEYELGVIADTGEIQFAITQSDNTWSWHRTGVFVNPDEWAHVAVTYDGTAGEAKTYINGELVDTYLQSGNIGDVYTAYDDLFIGGRENDADERFNGQIDEVRIWDTTRSQTDIQNNYSDKLTGAEPGLAGYWRLNEADGTLVADMSANNNDGTLGGAEGAASTPTYDGYFTDQNTTLVIAAVDGVLANDFDADGDSLAVTNLDTTGMLGTLNLNAADGSFSYEPNGAFDYLDAGEIAYETFTYTANDSALDSNIVSVTITVIGANDAPVAVDDSITATEDTPFSSTVDLDFNDTDIDGDALSVVPGTFATTAGGSITIAADGSYTYTPAANFNGADSVNYTVTDGALTDVGTLNITVTAVNDAPVAVDDSITATEDTPFTSTIDLDANDTDIDGDALTVVPGTFATTAGGSITIAVDGSYTYTPAANFNGADSVNYTVTDGALTDVGTLNITVNPVNEAPVAVDDSITAIEDTPFTSTIDLDANDTDIDGDALTVVPGTFATTAGGSITIAADGSYTYTPAANFNGADSVNYTVTDGALTDVGTLNITVNPVNEAPVAVDDSITAIEDTPFTSTIDLDANDTDIDGDALTVVPGTFATTAGGSITIAADGSYTYTPAANFNGADSVNYTVTDGSLTDVGTLSITVTAVNDAPVAVDDSITAIEDTLFTSTIDLDANDTDIDGDALTVVPGTFATTAGGSITIAVDGSYTYTPAANFNGADSVNYTVTDGALTDIGTLNITVTAVNDAPVAIDDSITATEDTPFSSTVDLDFNDTDLDGDALTVVPGTFATTAGGSITIAADGSYTYTPAANFNGADSVNYTVTDGALTDVGTLNITVNPVNEAPVAVDDSITAIEDTLFTSTIDLDANDTDIDGDALTVVPGTFATTAGGSITIAADGSYTYTPAANFNGADSVNYTLTDGSLTDVGTLNITVTAVNDAPVAIDDSITATEDTPFSSTVDLDFNDTDIDGDALTVVPGTFATTAGGSITIAADGSYTYTPASNFNGADSVNYTVTDGSLTDVGTLNITVTAVNDAPVAIDDSITATEDTPFSSTVDLDFNDTDIDGDALTVVPGTFATTAGGSITIAADGSYTYTPAANFNGVDSVNYTVTDGALTDVGTLNITVNPVNEAPVAVDDSITAIEDTPFTSTIDLDANDTDIDGDALTVVPGTFATTAGGSITIAVDGSYTYTPAANFNGVDSVNYTVTDGALTDVGTLNITVNPVNEAPVAVDDSITAIEDTPFTSTIDLDANDTDIDGDALTVVPGTFATTAGGSITIAVDGSYTYTPAANFNGADSVNYTVTDGSLTDVGTLNITVTAVNDAPVAIDDSITATEDTPFTSTIDLDANDTDIDGDALTVVPGTFATTAGGSITIAVDGSYTYTPAANFNGADSVDYTVTDGALTDVGTLNITVTAVNDAPVAVDESITATEDTPFTSTVDLDFNDTDLDGDVLSVVPGTFATAAGGSITIAADGSYTYTPAANFNGVDSVNYTVTDGALTDVGTLNITVTAVNDAPVAVDDAIIATEDTPFTSTIDLDANDTDLDGDALSVVPGTFATTAGGSITIAVDGSYTYTPAANFNGADSVNYTLTDGSLTDVGTLNITVTAVNEAPVIGGADRGAVTEDQNVVASKISTSGTLTIADPNAGESSFIGTTVNGALGALTIDTAGNWRYSADNGNPEIQSLQSGESITDTLTVTTADGTTHDVVITINGAAEAAPPPPPPVVEPPIVEPPPEAEPPPEEETETGGGVDPIVDDIVRAPQDVTPPPVQEVVDNSGYLQQEQAEADKAETSAVKEKYVAKVIEQPQAQAIQQRNLSLDELSLQVSDDAALNEKFELELLARIDSMHSNMDGDAAQTSADDVEVQIVMGSTASLTAGIVSWVLRGGSLLASFMSTVPLLNRFDPLPILKSREEKEDVEEDTDDDDADTKFKKHQKRVDNMFSAKDAARDRNEYMNE